MTLRSEHDIRSGTASGGIFTHNVATVSHSLAPFIHNFLYKNPETVWYALTIEVAGFSETLHTTELRAITFKRAKVSRPLRKPRT